MSLSETMAALMDKAREITGLTEKISIARLTGLMNSLTVTNLISESSNDWVKVSNAWNKSFKSIEVLPGETYDFGAEVKDNQYNVTLAAIMYDSTRHMLKPDTILADGTAPIHEGNEGGAYTYIGWKLNPGKMSMSITIKPKNCKYLVFKIPSLNKGDFTYRNPIAFKEVGGVISPVLSTIQRLFPSMIGGVADVA